MDTDVIKSYLVALGWQIDNNQLRQFEQTLAKVQREVEHHTTGLGSMFVKLTGSIVGAYAAISAATIGLADHVSQGELDFQLYAMQMYMSVDAAKKMKIASEALGYSLDQIAWNPELRQRFRELIQEQAILQKQLGGDYQKQMKNMRDIRFEFTKLGVAFQYLGMSVVANVARAFGLDNEEGLKKLDGYLTDFIRRIPEISQGIATDLVPALKEAWQIAKDLGAATREVGTVLVHGIGEVMNDPRLSGELTFQKLLWAIDDVDKAVKTTWNDIKVLFQALNTFGDVLDDLQQGKWKKAEEDFKKAIAQAQGMENPAPGTTSKGGPIIQPGGLADWARWLFDPRNRYGAGYPMPGATPLGPDTMPPAARPPGVPEMSMRDSISAARDSMVKTIIATAQGMGVSPAFALALAKSEDPSFDPKATSPKGAQGLMQLMPDTSKQMGVNDPFDPAQNVTGGLKYYMKLLERFGTETLALEAYNWGPEKLARALATGGRIPADVQQYARDVEAREIAVGGVTINIVNPHATKEEIEVAVVHALEDALIKRTQRTLSQTTGVYR